MLHERVLFIGSVMSKQCFVSVYRVYSANIDYILMPILITDVDKGDGDSVIRRPRRITR
jgi:hypothetical protein